MTKPLSPKDIAAAKRTVIPDAVMEAANELLARSWNGHSANFTLPDLCNLAREKLGVTKAEHTFGDGELDIEIVFRKAGWDVEFDRPGYCETYDANWTFRKRRAR